MAAKNLGRAESESVLPVIEANHLRVLPAKTLRLVGDLGSRATILQVSAGFCAPCRSARFVFGRVAATEPGVRHVEIDLALHPDQAELLRVESVPTTFVVSADGTVMTRFRGVPQLAAARELITAGAAQPLPW